MGTMLGLSLSLPNTLRAGGLVPPAGFVFMLDPDGAYQMDSDGYYLVEEI